jgi:hypothetical protein
MTTPIVLPILYANTGIADKTRGGAGDVAKSQSACLASARPWAQPKEENRRREEKKKRRRRRGKWEEEKEEEQEKDKLICSKSRDRETKNWVYSNSPRHR